MNEGLIPNRYAKALYKYSLENKEAETVYEQMKHLSDSFESHKELKAMVDNPYLPFGDKERVLLTAAQAPTEGSLSKFIKMINDNNRIGYIRGMALAYQSLFRKDNSIEEVVITTAGNMDESELEKIRKVVQEHEKNMKLEFVYSVNPDLIGGFTIRMDSKLLDASIKNELKKLRLKLLS